MGLRRGIGGPPGKPNAGAVTKCSVRRKQFFFEKKNQKTFVPTRWIAKHDRKAATFSFSS